MKMTAGAVTIAAVGAAALMAYSSMKPHAKHQLKKEFKDTFHHMDDVKDELISIRHDMTEMAKTLKNQM